MKFFIDNLPVCLKLLISPLTNMVQIIFPYDRIYPGEEQL
jgi:hypothetical protein